MKKYKATILMVALALAAMAFNSCGKDDPDPDPEPQGGTTPHYALHYQDFDNPAVAEGDTVTMRVSEGGERPTILFYVENLTDKALASHINVKQTRGTSPFVVCYAGACRSDQSVEFTIAPGLNPEDPNSLMYIELESVEAADGDAIFKIMLGEGTSLNHATTIYGRFINDLAE